MHLSLIQLSRNLSNYLCIQYLPTPHPVSVPVAFGVALGSSPQLWNGVHMCWHALTNSTKFTAFWHCILIEQLCRVSITCITGSWYLEREKRRERERESAAHWDHRFYSDGCRVSVHNWGFKLDEWMATELSLLPPASQWTEVSFWVQTEGQEFPQTRHVTSIRHDPMIFCRKLCLTILAVPMFCNFLGSSLLCKIVCLYGPYVHAIPCGVLATPTSTQ